MGVYIKGMEMPQNCEECDLKVWDEYDDVDYVCQFSGVTVLNIGRQGSCPLVEVPPHGIIDREQILDAIRLELAQANAVNDMDDYDEWMRVFDYVRKFPTVIPASEEGEA